MCLTKRNFYASFVNEKGWRLTVFFKNYNWHSFEKEARKALKADKQHEPHGPWQLVGGDVA